VYSRIEAPKGELGFYVASDGTTKPYRVKIRSPSFCNLVALPKMVVGLKIPDLIAALVPLTLFLAMWTGDMMITNAYDLIVAILSAIGLYDIILGFFQGMGAEYVLRIIIVLVVLQCSLFSCFLL